MSNFASLLLISALTTGAGTVAPPQELGSGQGITEIEVFGNQIVAHIQTSPSGFEALLVVTFENPDGSLSPDSLDLSATEVDPSSPAIRSRLPNGFFVPARFPVLIKLDQGSTPGEGVTYDGGFTVELLTSHLDFRANSPWRLLKGPDGGQFEDITQSIGLGSYRALGTGGSFSELVIAADLRPRDNAVNGKIQDTQTLIDTENGVGIDSATYVVLDNQLNLIDGEFQSGNYGSALMEARFLLETIVDEAEVGNIENSYDGSGDVSLAGVLLGLVNSMRFSIELVRLEDNERTEIVETDLTTGGGATLTVRVKFTGSQALELDNLSISAVDVSPTDPILLARLPAGVQIPSEFPVLIHIDPGSNVEQVFRADIEIEVETENLDFFNDSLLRLFKAPDGGAFTDITETYGLGSFRVLGTGGSFSELLIGRDLRTNSDVLEAKFFALRAILQANESDIDPAVYTSLETLLDDAELAYSQGNLPLAMAKVKAFLNLVDQESGQGIPDIWVSTAGVSPVNVAAKLLSVGKTMRFSLEVESNPASDPADANRDGVVDAADVFYIINRVFPGP